MIRFSYAFRLSNTKLKSKKALVLVSVLVSSVLFAVLVAGVVIFNGAQHSALRMVQKANEGLYRVQVSPVLPDSIYTYERPLTIGTINRLNDLQKKYYSDLKAKYVAAGVKYDTSTEIPALKPALYVSPGTPDALKFDVNNESPVIQYDQDLKIKEYVKSAKNKIEDLTISAKTYGATDIHSTGNSATLGIPNLLLLKSGKVDYGDTEMEGGDLSGYGYSINAIHNGSYEFQDDTLLNRYILSNSGKKTLKGIPVVATAQELSSLFGKEKNIGKEPNDDQDKASWLKNIQDQFNGYTYQACYRNSSEQKLIQKAQSDYSEIQINKSNKDYKEPHLQYELPTNGCGDIAVKKDVRTTEEKKEDASALDDQKKLGLYLEPQHKLLTFEVVGVMYAQHYTEYSANIKSYLQTLLSTENSGFNAYVPKNLYDNLPDSMKFMQEKTDANSRFDGLVDAGLSTHVVDFSSTDQARKFMDEQTCPVTESDCNKLYLSTPYGSNYLILDDIGKLFTKIMFYAFPVVLFLAGLIIWFNMSRVMSENKKETAVYRAMGAKRVDIASIYIIYGLTLALLTAAVALLVGIAAGIALDYLYSPSLTAIASSSFGVADKSLKFSLFDLNSVFIIAIIFAIFVISIVGMIYPLIRSVRRSPIKDMRDE